MKNGSLHAFAVLARTVLLLCFLLQLGGQLAWAQDTGSATQPPPTAVSEQTGQPVVRFLLYYSETCSHCHFVMEEYLPTVFEKYGDQVEYEFINVSNDAAKYTTMLALETKLGIPEEDQGGVPTLIIGDKVLIGDRDIPDKLEGYIDEYLALGGVDYPSMEDLPEVVIPTPAPTVQILVFFGTGHPEFDALNTLMVDLGRQYGSQLQAFAIDVTPAENAEKLAELDEALGVGEVEEGKPQVLIARQMLVGVSEIEAQLPGLIEDYLAQGGTAIPPWEELIGETEGATPPPATAPTASEPEPIYLAYFEQSGCQECARTTNDLNVVETQYPQLVVESYSIEDPENKALNEWLSEKYDVPEEKRLSTPMIFVGSDVLIGTDAFLDDLLAAVGKYADVGAPRVWDDFDPDEAQSRLVDRFQSFGLLTVLGAGLVDGLNPCAFATLVFFISYLAFTGRRGREILLVGISFALGVFLTYLLVGVGLLKVVQSLSFFTALGRWVYLITAALCVFLAAFTFRDYIKARDGQITEMALALPLGLRRRIHKVIREGAQVRAFVAMALVTGFVVSLLELACTGQVYLPTIMFVMSVPELAARAVLYLVLYCLMFILPLVVVFVLSYLGTSSEQLGVFVNRHTAAIKLATGLLFLGLALWMTWTLLPLFRVAAPWNWVLMGSVVLVVAVAVFALYRIDQRTPDKAAPRGRRSRA